MTETIRSDYTPDLASAMAFAQRFIADTSAAAVGVMCAIGNRLGLFADLAARGPATSSELAARTHLTERYVREWLAALASAGYLEFTDGVYTLPPANAAVLAAADGPFYAGDMARLIPSLCVVADRVTGAFRTGAGVGAADYPDEFYETMFTKDASRLSRVLVPEWIPAVAGLPDALRSGGRVAQLGCGDGRALALLATAFPAMTGVGYDPVAFNIARARAEAAAAGLAGRLSFRQADPVGHLEPGLDLVIALDVLHDAADPLALLRAVRAALAPHGVFLLLETNGPDAPPGTASPVNALLYGISTLYTVPQAIAAGSDPVGMMGLPAAVLLPMATSAGFATARAITSPSPFNTLYELRVRGDASE